MYKILKKGSIAVCFCLTVYQLVIGWVGTPISLQHRPLSIGIVLFVLFTSYNIKGERTEEPKLYDIVLAFLALASCLFVFANADWYTRRFMLSTPMSVPELFFGAILLILTLEAGRRVLGFAMPLICVLVILYGRFGNYLPLPWKHRGFSFSQIIEVLTTSGEGLWGSPTHAATTFVFMFVIFGALAESTGMGKFFMDFALSLTGRYAGGPAKTAVVSSGLMGTIQGSSISNVVTTGVFTIPAMKKYGFPAEYAGAVEAVASTGGQIMPPIMGASAFIMADMIGIPYMQIAKYAIIPAALYYISVFAQIHFKAKAMSLTGYPKEELPSFFKDVVVKQGVYAVPIFLIIYLTLTGYSLMRAGLCAIALIVALGIFFAQDKKAKVKEMLVALSNAPQSMCTVVAAVLNAGIIIGIVFISGLGLRLSGIIVSMAGGVLIYALLLTFVLSVILGMGMPTSGAYIIMGTLLAPALTKLGLQPVQAHMFVFYFACMSSITPPVAVAAYAAAGIAKANPQKVGFIAWRMAIVAFIIPFMFAYQPDLLMLNGFKASIFVFITATLGCICLAGGLEGFLIKKANILQRFILSAGGILLMYPTADTDIYGAILILITIALQFAEIKKDKIRVVKESL